MASKNEMDASCKLYGGSDMSGRPITMVLIVLMLAFPCVGQRAGGGMHGSGMSMGGPGPGFGGRPGFPNRPFFQFGFRHFRNFGGFGGLWWGYPGWGSLGWDSPWNCWYWSLDPRGNWCGDSPQSSDPYASSAKNGYATPIIIQSGAPAAPTPPPEPPKVIEVSTTGKENPPSQSGQPTLFVMANGDRLEAHRYMLTADYLDIQVGQQRRRVPMSQLNVPQTIAANRERGIEIKVPHDASEVTLGF